MSGFVQKRNTFIKKLCKHTKVQEMLAKKPADMLDCLYKGGIPLENR